MAGAITTSDATLADRLKRLRNGGQRTTYQHDEFGVNSRLDEMQAAILRERLQRLPAWTAQRRAIAAHYRAHLAGASVHVPREYDAGHVYHLFVVRTPQRDAFRAHMTAQGVQTLVHYPKALTQQPAIPSESPVVVPGSRARSRRGVLAAAVPVAVDGRRRTWWPRAVQSFAR